jgi:hypothetical protein
MAKQKFRPIRLGVFSGAKAYIAIKRDQKGRVEGRVIPVLYSTLMTRRLLLRRSSG